MTERADGQVTWADLGLWSGKTCPEHSQVTKGETSRQSSKRSSASQSRKPPILKCLTRAGQPGGGYHDCMGGRWSVAWRVHDAQHWGVPQRRRRISEDIKRLVATVEKWSREHPRKTRQSVFLEQYPDADISDDGLPDVAPCQLCVGLIHGESIEDCENRGLCVECRREFWMQEVE